MTPKLTSWTGLDVDIGEDGRISLTATNPERVKAASATVRSCEQRIAVMEKVVAELDRMGVVSWEKCVTDQTTAQVAVMNAQARLSAVGDQPKVVARQDLRYKTNERYAEEWERKKAAEREVANAQAAVTATTSIREAVATLLREAGIVV